MSKSSSESESPMRPMGPIRGRDLCHGMEYHFFDDPCKVRILPTKTKWGSIAETSWLKIIRGESIRLKVNQPYMSPDKFLPQGVWKVSGFKVYWYRCATGRWKDILVREVPGVLMVKCWHIPNPYQENSVLIAHRQERLAFETKEESTIIFDCPSTYICAGI